LQTLRYLCGAPLERLLLILINLITRKRVSQLQVLNY
jgi:hypothetical protein